MLTPNTFANASRVLAKQNKMTHVTPHILRHAWVSQMIALGYDAVTIAKMTGHSPEVLLRTYAHAFDKRKREAVDALGEARRAARVEA
jgi:integrase